MTIMSFSTFLLVLIGVRINPSYSFSSVAPTRAASNPSALPLGQDETYAKSFDLIDECAASGVPSDELYNSVRYSKSLMTDVYTFWPSSSVAISNDLISLYHVKVDKNALRLYPDVSAKSELWKRAHGSWKLQLATGGGKFTTFKPVPIFAYAMIDERCFGNGVGFNQDKIILSLLGPHHFNTKRRQMGIGIDDIYLFSNEVTQFVPNFMAEGMLLGKTPDDFKESKTRMPTFTIIGASNKSLIARGGTGGIAIWTRLEKDIRPAAYGT